MSDERIVVRVASIQTAPHDPDIRVLHEHLFFAKSIGAALDEWAPDPAKGAEFIVEVIATDVEVVE